MLYVILLFDLAVGLVYGMIFYKYKSLARAEDVSFLSDYLSQKIWMPPVHSLNDPFEGKFVIVDPEYLLEGQYLIDIIKEHKIEGEQESIKEEFKKKLSSPGAWEKEANVYNSFLSEHGALCLTDTYSNIPMWSYYANDHHGYCLVFELDFSYFSDEKAKHINEVINGEGILSFTIDGDREFVLTKVIYQREMPTFSLQEYDKIPKDKMHEYPKIEYLVKRSLGVKAQEWAHEREYRLITNSNSKDCGWMNLGQYVPFLSIKGIIMGYKMAKNIKQIIQSLCKKYSIQAYEAKLSDTKYLIDKNSVEV